MVIEEAAGLKSGELVMTGILGGDCRDKTAVWLLRSYSILITKKLMKRTTLKYLDAFPTSTACCGLDL